MTRSYNTSRISIPTQRVCKECSKEYFGSCNSKYCSPLCLSRNEYAANMFKPGWRLNKLCAMAKNRAKDKNLAFDINTEYLLGLWDSNQGTCCISKRKFDLSSQGYNRVNPNAPSIDRIVPSLGYTKGNIRLVTYHVNVAISEFGLEALIQLAKEISNES